MVTYYNKKDLIAFGKYLLSSERHKLIVQARELSKSEIPENEVLHSDYENWLHKNKKTS